MVHCRASMLGSSLCFMTFTHLYCSPAIAGMDTKDAAAAAEGWLEAPYASAAQLIKNVTSPSAWAGKIGPLSPAK